MRFGKKFAVNSERLCVDQMSGAWDTARRGFVGGFDDFNCAVAANPEVIKCSDPGLKPEPNPFTTEKFPILSCHGRPVVRHQHEVRNLPLGKLASMPHLSSIGISDGVNKVCNVQVPKVFSNQAVMLFPVQEEGVPDALGLFWIGWWFAQKSIAMIRRIAKRTWRWRFAIPHRQMRKDATRMAAPVSPAYGHRLFASGATSSKRGIRAEFAPKLHSCESFGAVRVKGFFHGRPLRKWSSDSRRNQLGDARPAQWLRERGQTEAAALWENYR